MKIHRWHEIPVERLGDGITRQLMVGENMMLSRIFVNKGVSFPAHGVASEQMTIFVKGSAVYESDNQALEASEGDIIHIPPGIEHADQVTEDTIVLDIFAPPRSDWLKA